MFWLIRLKKIMAKYKIKLANTKQDFRELGEFQLGSFMGKFLRVILGGLCKSDCCGTL